MTSVGSFGAARAEARAAVEPDTFEFYGETFRIADRLGGAPLFDYAEAVTSDLDIKDLQAMVAVKEMIRDCIWEEDWSKFWASYKRHKGTAEDLAELSSVLYQHLAARPTVQPSDSSSGPSSTGNTSSGSASPTLGVSALTQASTPTGNPGQQVAPVAGGWPGSQVESPATSHIA